MKKRSAILFPMSVCVLGLLVSTGCDRSPSVIVAEAAPTPAPVPSFETEGTRTLLRELEKYEAEPGMLQAARVENALAAVDREIEAASTGSGNADAGSARAAGELRNFRNSMQDRFLRSKGAIHTEERRQIVTSPSPPAPDAAAAEGNRPN